MIAELIRKYNVAVPRYTSYPTVPQWNTENWSASEWQQRLVRAYQTSAEKGISLYIHLPYCESLCTYCGCNTRITRNHQVELPYIQAVLKEWRQYVELLGEKPLITDLHLGGGTPTFFSPENLAVLLEGIFAQAVSADVPDYSFEGHPANTSRQHLETLYQFGFRRLSLGIQDFDPVVQFTINRFQSVEQVKDVTDAAREIGYTSINYDLIYGLPKQQRSGLADTLEAVGELRPDRIAFYSYAHVPWLKPGQRSFTEKDLPADAEKRELYEMGEYFFLNSGYRQIGMDHFALPEDALTLAADAGQLNRNFMGYTDKSTDVLIGLGVSSISDCGDAFAQNLKKVEEYTAAIEAGEPAVCKGHLHTAEDKLIRQLITDLMCRYQATLDLVPETEQEPVRDRLKPLEEDDLITLQGNTVMVTNLGKMFLRNCCLPFDLRHWEKVPGTTSFSLAV